MLTQNNWILNKCRKLHIMFGLFWRWVPFGISTEYNYNYLLKNYLEVIVSFVYVFLFEMVLLARCSFGYRHWTLNIQHWDSQAHIHTSFYMADTLPMTTTIWQLANDNNDFLYWHTSFCDISESKKYNRKRDHKLKNLFTVNF